MLNYFNHKKQNTIEDKVSILVPTRFDSRYIIELCIKSIRRHTNYPDYEIIVGNAGVDDATHEFLLTQQKEKIIKLINISNRTSPNDELVGTVQTKYFVLMHDDIKILKDNWLKRRMALLTKNRCNAIVGSVVNNFGAGSGKRFFTLGLLIKTEISRKLDLLWDKQYDKGLDTGGDAFKKFSSQSEYNYICYKTTKDIYHFTGMSWPLRKRDLNQNHPDLENLIFEREKKIRIIRDILNRNAY